MEAFYYILQKHMRPKAAIIQIGDLSSYWGHIFNNERDTLNNNRSLGILFYWFIAECFKDILKIKNQVTISDLSNIKFYYLNSILINAFVSNQDEVLLFFCKVQRSYWAFSRLAYRYRLKKAPTRNTMDLYMNPIDVSKPSSMVIFQDGAKYYFRIPDLINIIDQALLNHCHHFPEPLYPKNPYTNLEFSEVILLNIYEKIRRSYFKFPILLHYFYLSQFNVEIFLYEYESIINDFHIRDYTYKSSSHALYEDVELLLKLYNRPKKLHIDKDFPKNRLVDIMRPYLYLHYVYEYSISETEKRETAIAILKEKFQEFITFNPQFGRKIMVRVPGKKHFKTTFNDSHINFNACC